MAKLRLLKFTQQAENGETISFNSEASVTNDGVFSLVIPEFLTEIAKDLSASPHYSDCKLSRPRESLKVTSRALDACSRFMKAACEEYLRCVITTDRVIIYSNDTHVSCWKGLDGKLYANGREARVTQESLRDDAGKWLNFNNDNHYFRNEEGHFSIGLNAKVVDKITYTRASGSQVKYERVDASFKEGEEALSRLNSFTNIEIPLRLCKEIPYTEQAAQFFYESMIGICMMAERMEAFFANADEIAEKIKNLTDHPLLLSRPFTVADEGKQS